ncbi:MAG TPA: hypothetical protein VGN34_08660, partial [Ktedonobacteraceae bacterium]
MQMFSQGDPAGGLRLQRTLNVRRIVALLLIAALMAAAMSFALSSGAPSVHAAPTWNQIWSDEFNGVSGTGVNTSNWLYDTGTGWGTGEVETMTNSTSNV